MSNGPQPHNNSSRGRSDYCRRRFFPRPCSRGGLVGLLDGVSEASVCRAHESRTDVRRGLRQTVSHRGCGEREALPGNPLPRHAARSPTYPHRQGSPMSVGLWPCLTPMLETNGDQCRRRPNGDFARRSGIAEKSPRERGARTPPPGPGRDARAWRRGADVDREVTQANARPAEIRAISRSLDRSPQNPSGAAARGRRLG